MEHRVITVLQCEPGGMSLNGLCERVHLSRRGRRTASPIVALSDLARCGHEIAVVVPTAARASAPPAPPAAGDEAGQRGFAAREGVAATETRPRKKKTETNRPADRKNLRSGEIVRIGTLPCVSKLTMVRSCVCALVSVASASPALRLGYRLPPIARPANRTEGDVLPARQLRSALRP